MRHGQNREEEKTGKVGKKHKSNENRGKLLKAGRNEVFSEAGECINFREIGGTLQV